LINIISKMSATKSDDAVAKGPGDVVSSKSKDGREVVPPSLSTTALSTPTAANAPGPMTGTAEISLRRQALECLVSVLRSLVTWGTTAERSVAESEERPHSAKHQDSISSQRNGMTNASTERLSISHETSRVSTPDVIDDPGRFESAKQKKTLLMDGIKKFNFKPQRARLSILNVLWVLTGLQGIQFLIEAGFIPDNDRVGLAKFLMNTEGLNKAMIGEYLGEGSVGCWHTFRRLNS
jgi:brefeldin A-inhibited guanine nucleotide-exchange protein